MPSIRVNRVLQYLLRIERPQRIYPSVLLKNGRVIFLLKWHLGGIGHQAACRLNEPDRKKVAFEIAPSCALDCRNDAGVKEKGIYDAAVSVFAIQNIPIE